MATIDLNADLGEGFGAWRIGDDEAMLAIVTTANLACGLHAGDPLIMRRTLALAAAAGVAVGAHPGPHDLWGFGRRSVTDIPARDLATLVVYQVGALDALARREGVRIGHVKLHGAMSSRAAVDADLALAVAEEIAALDQGLAWLVPAGSAMAAAATAVGVRAVAEVFADRAYAADGTLLPRSAPGAVISDPQLAARRAVAMAGGVVEAVGGTRLELPAHSICVHGDSPGAVAMAGAVRAALLAAEVRVEAFTLRPEDG